VNEKVDMNTPMRDARSDPRIACIFMRHRDALVS
jgi:type IV secretory pathway TrbD component